MSELPVSAEVMLYQGIREILRGLGFFDSQKGLSGISSGRKQISNS